MNNGMSLLLRVWRSVPGDFFCISSKTRKKEWEDKFFKRSKLKDALAYIRANLDRDLYWCPHGYRRPRRRKEDAVLPSMLWADLDEVDPRKMDLKPTVAWESSPGRYAALWLIDKTMTEELNQRLTYSAGADRGGWDLTQVLRVPGTRNYKYPSTPTVRMLWANGSGYTTTELEKKLPRVTWSAAKPEEVNALAIYHKYEKKFSPFLRRELLKGKPKPGTRSEVLWKLGHELIEAGCTRDEAFQLLRMSPWNKFADRRNGDDQLKRELDKALSEHLRRPDFGTEPDDEDYRFLSKSMEQVEEENIDWLWYPYLARGEVTILEGDPGLGKSYLAQMIAMHICDGETLPSPKRRRVQGRVAYFDLENSAGSVTKKRLLSNGAKNLGAFFQEEETFSVDDLDKLADVFSAIEELSPLLVVFDTVNTYIGGADTHHGAQTQQAFKTFITIARKFNCAVLVLRHLTKSSKGEKALYRGQGNIAFAGLARVVITCGMSPDEPGTRAFAVTKINVAKAPKAMTFTIESLPDTLREMDRSKFVWGDYVDLTADDLVAMPSRRDSSNGAGDETSVADAVAFLRGALAHGSALVEELERNAAARSITRKTLQAAAKEAGVVRSRETAGRRRLKWSLPEAA